MSVIIPKDQKPVFQTASIIIPGVELIGIINKRGKMTNCVGLDVDMSSDKKEMFLMKIALRTAMQKDFDEELGPANYSMTQRGNKRFISIPTFDDNTILVVTKADFAYEELVTSIIQTLKHSDQFLGQMFFNGGR